MTEALIRMPRLADTLVEGTVGQWLKQVGDRVGQGEPLASIETDKVTTELTSPAAGTVLELLVPPGSTVPIETPIARIGVPRSVTQTRTTTSSEPASSPPFEPHTPSATPKPTPVAARMLAEHGLSADQVPGRSTRLTKAEVLAFLARRTPDAGAVDHPSPALRALPPTPIQVRGGTASPARSAPDDLIVPLTPMRRAIAEHMTTARLTIPHGQTVMDADLTALVAWREQHKAAFLQQEGANLTFTVFFVHVLARALAASTGAQQVHLGVAVALDAGLIVPVLRAANSLSLPATARGIADLAQRARTNRLALDETQGATMTVTNVGSFGNLTASPIIPLGQLGILGPGLVEPRPMPGPHGAIRPGWRCLLSLMFDRRAFTDFEADRLLRATVTQLVELPATQLSAC